MVKLTTNDEMSKSEGQDASGQVTSLVVLKRRREFLRGAAGRNKWATGSLILQGLPRMQNTPDGNDQRTVGISGSSADVSSGGTARDMKGFGGRKGPRVGFTTSKKVGNAVARNRARRRLREAARQVLPHFAREDYDYVLIGRPETVTVSFTQMIRDLEQAISKVNAPRRRPVKGKTGSGDRVFTSGKKPRKARRGPNRGVKNAEKEE